MVIWVYGVLILLFIIFYIATRRYRRKERQKLDNKESPLSFMYGMAMFLADGLFKRVVLKNGENLEMKFKGLYVKEKVEAEKYYFIVFKLSLSILIVFAACVFGLLLEISYESDKITVLERKEYGAGDSVYDLTAEVNGEAKQFAVVVSEKEFTQEEIVRFLEGKKEELVKEVLGENESLQKVTKPLHLVSSIGEETIPVVWEIADENIINYDGTLGTNVSSDGEVTKIFATLVLGEVSVRHELVLQVFPMEDEESVEQSVQKYIDEYDIQKKEVVLPDKVGEQSINFYSQIEHEGRYFLPIGILAAILLFVGKDKEIDKQVKERNRQMLMDYPEVVSKIMLLNMAGMSMRKAWEKTIRSSGDKGNHYVYQEMKLSYAKISGGITESAAYEQFGKRCGLHCYIRFANIINQNLKRGNNELCKVLNMELQEAMQERKNNVLKTGEEAGTKLLAPMMVMLIIAMAIIVVPAFLSMKF